MVQRHCVVLNRFLEQHDHKGILVGYSGLWIGILMGLTKSTMEKDEDIITDSESQVASPGTPLKTQHLPLKSPRLVDFSDLCRSPELWTSESCGHLQSWRCSSERGGNSSDVADECWTTRNTPKHLWPAINRGTSNTTFWHKPTIIYNLIIYVHSIF